jgi:hypothetical protein
MVVRKRLDDHPSTVLAQSLFHVLPGADWIAHVVQAIEERHKIIPIASVTGLGVVNPSFCGCPFAGVVLLYGVGAQAAT